MAIYVKSGGTWREISSSAGGQVYVRDATSFTNKTIINGYIKDGSTWRTVFTLFDTPTSYTTASDGAAFAVPTEANAIHIQSAVGAGGGGGGGLDYDKAGFEDGGGGGGSGAFTSDMVFSVTGGETLTPTISSSGGSGGGGVGEPPINTVGGTGGNTVLSGSSSGAIFTLNGGVGSASTGGRIPAPASTGGAGGSRTIDASQVLSSGTTVDGIDITSFTSGPVGSFNQQGDGTTGPNGNRSSGDNTSVAGAAGGTSFNTSLPGGSGGTGSAVPGSAGSRGSGGGGGGSGNNSASGGAGGNGEIVYRFLRIA